MAIIAIVARVAWRSAAGVFSVVVAQRIAGGTLGAIAEAVVALRTTVLTARIASGAAGPTRAARAAGAARPVGPTSAASAASGVAADPSGAASAGAVSIPA